MIIEKYIANVIDADIYLAIGTFKQAQAFSTILLDEVIDWEDAMWLCLTNWKKVICFVIEENCKKEDYVETLNHEIIHWVHYLLDYIWHDLSWWEWNEMVAYYMSYFIERWTEFLDSLKIKDGMKSKSSRKWLKRVS